MAVQHIPVLRPGLRARLTASAAALSLLSAPTGLGAAVVGAAAVTGGATALGLVAAPQAEAAVVRPLTKVFEREVYGDHLVVGNGVMRCPDPDDPVDPTAGAVPIAECAPAQQRTANRANDSFSMNWADVDGDPSTSTSSSAALTLPPGATVETARLSWSGNTGRLRVDASSFDDAACGARQRDVAPAEEPPGSAATQQVRLTVGAGAAQAYAPRDYTQDPDSDLTAGQAQYYSASADVTDQLAAAPTGTSVPVTVADVWAPQGFGCYGGWSLTVVWSLPQADATHAPLRRAVLLYDGHVRVTGTTPATTSVSGLRVASRAVRVGLTAYEGDFSISGDGFRVNGVAQTEPYAGGSTTNFFTSDADGATSPRVPNTFSVDAKSFSTTALAPGATTAGLEFTTSGDSYLAQVLALSAPLPTVTLGKAATTTGQRPGEPVTFTVTAANPTSSDLVDVVVEDPSAPDCGRSFALLAGQASETWQCTTTMPGSDYANAASVTATDAFGGTVTASTTAAPVQAIAPAVDVEVTADRPAYDRGEQVVFSVSVTNTGDSTLSGTTVRDADLPACDRTFASLAPGETRTWTCTTAAPVAGGGTTVVATGTDLGGGTVTDTDTAAAPTTGSVAGTVLADRDDDGEADPGDTGIGGVQVALVGTTAGGSPHAASTATDGAGAFGFAAVPPGTYALTAGTPTGYRDGRDTAGSAATVTGDDAVEVVLGDGAGSSGTVFAEVPTGGLAGQVWRDDDGDGARGVQEPGLPGVALSLTGTDDGGHAVDLAARTDADGRWTFEALRPGTYAVTETQPAGLLDGDDVPGTAGGTAAAPDTVGGVVLAPGQQASGYGFAELPAASLRGAVTADGLPVAGVEVLVTGTDDRGDAVRRSAVTGVDGAWAVEDLRPGTYDVTEQQPVGYGDGPDTPGSAGGALQGPDTVAGVVLAPGQDGGGHAFTDTTSTLRGAVVVDADGDGAAEPGEPGVPGVTVTLAGTDAAGGAVSRTTATGPDGAWVLTGLLAGRYALSETQPPAWADGADVAGTAGGTQEGRDTLAGIDLGAGEDVSGYLFGETGGSLSGAVYVDADGDGVRGPGEVGLAGVEVTVASTDTGVTGRTVTTGADGTWTAGALPAGTWTVAAAQPAGTADGAEHVGTLGGTATEPDTITGVVVGAGSTGTGYDFGERRGTVSGTVWLDTDRDGVLDADETGRLPGVALVLRADDGTPDGGAEVGRAVTGPDGRAAFEDLPVGAYVLSQVQPDGYGSTTPSTVPVLAGPAAGAEVLFGEERSAVGDLVWSDQDGDGLRDPGEPGLPGVTVLLLDDARTELARTASGADGSYAFRDVAPGSYRLGVGAPAGSVPTRVRAGSDPAVDNDVDVVTGSSVLFTVGVGADGRSDVVDTLDVGLVAAVRDLAVSLSADDTAVAVGDVVTYRVVVANRGTVPEERVVVTFALPEGSELVGTDGQGWECAPQAEQVRCVQQALVRPGEELPQLDVRVRVRTAGSRTATVQVTTADGAVDARPDDDAAALAVTVAALAPRPRPADAAPAADGAPPAGRPRPAGRLPFTGLDVVPLAAGGLLLVLVGGLLVLVGRRPRTR